MNSADQSASGVEELHLIAYDVSSNRRRYRLARMLEGHGRRVQESVFEAWLTPRQREELLVRAEHLLHPDRDRLACYALTADDLCRVRFLGVAAAVTPNVDYTIL